MVRVPLSSLLLLACLGCSQAGPDYRTVIACEMALASVEATAPKPEPEPEPQTRRRWFRRR